MNNQLEWLVNQLKQILQERASLINGSIENDEILIEDIIALHDAILILTGAKAIHDSKKEYKEKLLQLEKLLEENKELR